MAFIKNSNNHLTVYISYVSGWCASFDNLCHKFQNVIHTWTIKIMAFLHHINIITLYLVPMQASEQQEMMSSFKWLAFYY